MAFIDIWQSWIWLAGLALGLMTILVAIVYMLSELLQNDKIKGWAKMEFTEIFYSALIIAMAMATLPLIDAVVQGSLGVSNTGVSTGGVAGPLGSPTSAWATARRFFQPPDSVSVRWLPSAKPAFPSATAIRLWDAIFHWNHPTDALFSRRELEDRLFEVGFVINRRLPILPFRMYRLEKP